jgi:hypothetical protein
VQPKTLPYQKKAFQPPPSPYQVDIASIQAIGLHYHLKRPENEAFSTSLYEIDRILESRYEEAEMAKAADTPVLALPLQYCIN